MPVDWNVLDTHVARFGKKVKRIKGDGYCFTRAMHEALVTDLGWNIDRKQISQRIMDEIYLNVPQYIHFHRITKGKDNTITSFIEDCQKFLFKKGYTVDATDVVIAASANALNINLYIYQEIGGKAVIVQQ